MRSSSGVGLGLSLIFGCLLLALIAELYYLLWWKKKATHREIHESYSSPASEFLYMFCWKKPSSLTSTRFTTDTQVHEPQPSSSFHYQNKDLWLKPFAEGYDDGTAFDAEQNLLGPPRFLFTIKEETKEDLEIEDMSDVVVSVETPFFTPLASPPFLTPPRESTFRAFSPIYQSPSDAEFNRIWASPPPKFKFLRDAEAKLERRKLIERFGVDGFVQRSDEYKDDDDGVKERKDNSHNITSEYPSSSSQVLPLVASPPTFRPQSHKYPKRN